MLRNLFLYCTLSQHSLPLQNHHSRLLVVSAFIPMDINWASSVQTDLVLTNPFEELKVWVQLFKPLPKQSKHVLGCFQILFATNPFPTPGFVNDVQEGGRLEDWKRSMCTQRNIGDWNWKSQSMLQKNPLAYFFLTMLQRQNQNLLVYPFELSNVNNLINIHIFNIHIFNIHIHTGCRHIMNDQMGCTYIRKHRLKTHVGNTKYRNAFQKRRQAFAALGNPC